MPRPPRRRLDARHFPAPLTCGTPCHDNAATTRRRSQAGPSFAYHVAAIRAEAGSVMAALDLAATEHGSGGKPLLVLHGLFGSARNWSSVAQRLAGTHHVLALD